MVSINWKMYLFQLIFICTLIYSAFGDPQSSNTNRRLADVIQEQRSSFSRRLNNNEISNAISIISAATAAPNTNKPATTPAINRNLRLSYPCIIYEIGHLNNVNVTFRFDSKYENGTDYKLYQFNLTLGGEHYAINSTTKRRAQELVAYEAINKTKFRMPSNAYDKCTFQYSASVLVHEWAQLHKSHVAYNLLEQKMDGNRPIFVMECFIPPILRTQAEAGDKKTAKSKAAEKMLPLLPIIKITDKLIPIKVEDAVNMHPVSRLNEILLAQHQKEPIYHLRDEIRMQNELGQPFSQFFIEVRVGDLITQGVGNTVKEAKSDASTKMLHVMNLPVMGNPAVL